MERVRLDQFNNSQWTRGRCLLVELSWMVASALLVQSWFPGSMHRRLLLRLFGAKVGKSVVIKPGVKVKFPWRLKIGDHSWIGEDVWLDNLADVDIGANVCISQGAYLCTGSHDWGAPKFDLIVNAIKIEDDAWVAANATIGPGVTISEGAVLGLSSTTTKNLEPWSIYAGSPAMLVRKRVINGREPPSKWAL
jgi:putative colanic acid biosynthesis acetyltransferase WcaF